MVSLVDDIVVVRHVLATDTNFVSDFSVVLRRSEST